MAEETPRTAGAVMRELRVAAGISNQEMGRRMNTQPSHLRRLETGKQRPSLDMVLRFCQGLNPGGTPVSLAAFDGVQVDLGTTSARRRPEYRRAEAGGENSGD